MPFLQAGLQRHRPSCIRRFLQVKKLENSRFVILTTDPSWQLDGHSLGSFLDFLFLSPVLFRLSASFQPKHSKIAYLHGPSQSIPLTSRQGWQKLGRGTTVPPPVPVVGITNQSRVCSLLSKIKASDGIFQPPNHSALALKVASISQLPSGPISHTLGSWDVHFSHGFIFFA